MTTRVLRAGATGLLLAGWGVGCQNPPQRSAYADNPLLVNRQPLVQANAPAPANRLAAPKPQVATVNAPPPPAAPPAVALTRITGDVPARLDANDGPALPSAFSATPATIVPLPARTLERPEPPPPIMPQPNVVEAPPAPLPTPTPTQAMETPRTSDILPVSAGGSTRRESGRYGFANDYSWLRGELDRHYRGHMDLRFRAASEEDTFGGKVRLDGDPRLSEYRAGDVVEIYGEMVQEPGGTSGGQYPRYHVKEIKLIERK